MIDKSINYLFHEILEKVLHLSDNPAHFAEYLSLQIRELVGARTILIAIQDENNVSKIFSVYPLRKTDWAQQPATFELIDLSFQHSKIEIWDTTIENEKLVQNLKTLDIEKAIIIPLIVAEKVIGSILLLDIMDMYGIEEMMKMLSELSGVFALIVRNSILFTNLENQVENRTAELKRRNEELLESETKYRNLIENSPDAIAIYTSKEIVYVNKECLTLMHAKSESELIGMHVIEFVHPDSRKLVIDRMTKALVKGKFLPSVEEKFIRLDGTTCDVNVKAIPITFEGQPAVQLIVRDITEQKEADLRLLEREVQYWNLANSGMALIWISGPDKLCTYFNETWLKFTGRRIEEELGNGWAKGVHPEDFDRCLMTYITSFDKHDAFSMEYRLKHVSGEYRWLIDMGTPNYNSNKEFIGYIGHCLDITERKKNEEKIIKLNRVNMVLSNVNHAIVEIRNKKELLIKACQIAVEDGEFIMGWVGILNSETNKVEVIASNGKIDGYLEKVNIDLNDAIRSQGPTGMAMKTGVCNFCNDIENDERMIPWRKDALARGYKSSITLPLEMKGISIGTLTLYSKEINSFNEEEIELLDKLAMDISFALEFIENESVRIEAERKLQENEKKLSTLFASMTEMVVIHELILDDQTNAIDYRILECNDAFSESTGIRREDAVGKLATQVYQTVEAPYLKEYTKVVITGESFEFDSYYEPMDKHFIISAVSIGENMFATIGTDISVIQNAQKELKEKNQELENYIYVASHDLRSPLVNVQGFSQRLEKQTEKLNTIITSGILDETKKQEISKIILEDVPKSLNFILNNVAKMDTLINGLLHLSRTGRIVLSVKKLDMNKLLNDVIKSFNFQLSECNAQHEINHLTDCYGDVNQLNQVFSNIIGNAIKYRDLNRPLKIEISSKLEVNKVKYSIKDNGIGINERQLEKIWDIFYRVDASSPEAGEGLGLSLARRIVEKHKGKIWAESEVNVGSVFHIELQKNHFEL